MALAWDPAACGELVTAGNDATLLFWMLDEQTSSAQLNVHAAQTPQELMQVA